MPKISSNSDFFGSTVSDSGFFNKKTESGTLSASSSKPALSDFHISAESKPTVAEVGKAIGVKVDPRTGDTVVVVYSKEDNRIIEEIPPEAARELSVQLDKLTGLLIDRYE